MLTPAERKQRIDTGLARARRRVAERRQEDARRKADEAQRRAAGRGADVDCSKMVEHCAALVKERDTARRMRVHEEAQLAARSRTHAQMVAQMAPAAAKLRLEARRQRIEEKKNREIDELVLRQTSSIEAMNLARLISPRFQQTLQFKRQVTGEDETRLRHLMNGDVIGHFTK